MSGHVQSATNGSSTDVSSYAVSFTDPTTSGNLLVLVVGTYVGAPVSNPTGVTDNKGNTWAPATAQTTRGVNATARTYYCYNATGGSSHQVTVSFDKACKCSVAIGEYDTLFGASDPLDQNTGTTGTATSVSSGSTGTTAQANELLIGLIYCDNDQPTITPTGGWTKRTEFDNPDFETICLFDQVVAATGTYAATATFSAGGWHAQIATFKFVVLSYEQEGYRFRADDGSETTASWLAAQDTPITRAAETNTRLRILVDTEDGDPPSTQFQLEYRKVDSASGEWHKVGE